MMCVWGRRFWKKLKRDLAGGNGEYMEVLHGCTQVRKYVCAGDVRETAAVFGATVSESVPPALCLATSKQPAGGRTKARCADGPGACDGDGDGTTGNARQMALQPVRAFARRAVKWSTSSRATSRRRRVLTPV